MKKISLIGIVALALVALSTAAILSAQSMMSAATPTARLAYADDESVLTVTDSKGTAKSIRIGGSLLAGDTIKTNASSAEFELLPSGSIVKVAPKSTLKIDSLASPSTKTGDALNLAVGKIRVIAAKSFTGAESLKVSTPVAVGGVRGTDFGIQYTSDAAWICVTEGTVRYTRTSDKKVADVAAGFFLRASDAAFTPAKADPVWIKNNLGDLEFKNLAPPKH